MIKAILSISAVFLFLFSHAQDIPKFGKIPKEYLEMTVYEKDSSAEAVVLFDIGTIDLIYTKTEGFKMVFEKRTAIKILTKDGYDWADQEVELYDDGSSEESISLLKGFTYNLVDGKTQVTKLPKTSKFSEQTNKYWKTKKFSMPDVKVGSVIEYTYKITSDLLFNLKPWNFQDRIPTMYSQLTKNIPEYYNYRTLSQGYHDFYRNESSTNSGEIIQTNSTQRRPSGSPGTSFSTQTTDYVINTQLLAAKDVPAMKTEAYTSTIDNYRMKVEFELQGTQYPGSMYEDYRGSWESLNQKYVDSQYFGGAIKHVGSLKNELDVIKTLDDDDEKIRKAHNLVRSKIKWNRFYASSAKSTLNAAIRAGEGNIADINLTLTGALRELGFNAYPVLSSTRSNGLVNEAFPISDQFNYVLTLVEIGGKEILMDASSSLPPGFIPQKCINGRGRLVSKGGGRWVDLGKGAKYRISYKVDASFDSDLTLKSNIQVDRIAYASFNQRNQISSKEESERVDQLEERYQFEIGNYDYENLDDASKPLIEKFDAEIDDKVEQAGNLILVKPLLIGGEDENPFKPKTREYPVDFTFPIYSAYQGKIQIPEGYKIDQIPEPAGIGLPNRKGRFLFSVQEKDNTLVVTSVLDLRSALFLPEEYPFLKEFFSRIVEKHNENIVFTKI